MARDVHDVIGRTLTLVALKADLVERLTGRDGEAASKEARKAHRTVSSLRLKKGASAT